MKRKIYKELIEWKNSQHRMPLLLIGARQVGKTYILNEFSKNEYENTIFCNLEKQENIKKLFDIDLSPKRIIADLEAIFKQKILPGKTLIVFDEIQGCEKALSSLKYFKEEANEYHVVGSGSLLGVAINRCAYSFPVGCVDKKHLYPMDFEEFLKALNHELLIDRIKQCYKTKQPLAEQLHNEALDLYKKYLYIGGMPEVIKIYIESNNNILVREKQESIITDYLSDMSKYNTPLNTSNCQTVFNSVAKQLSKENTKFQYSLIKHGARASEFEKALKWICTAGITTQLFKLETVKIPLNEYASVSSFKLYLNDVGLLCALHKVDYEQIVNRTLQEFQGGLTENYVFNQLRSNKMKSYYWTSKHTAEVNFVCSIRSKIIPIEVKSNINNHVPSLRVFNEQYKPEYSIKISAKNFGYENKIMSIPLYAVFCLTEK